MTVNVYRNVGSSGSVSYLTDTDPSIAPGIPAELGSLCARTDVPGMYCHTGPLDTDWTLLVSASVGDITAVIAGTNLSGGGVSGPVTLDVVPNPTFTGLVTVSGGVLNNRALIYPSGHVDVAHDGALNTVEVNYGGVAAPGNRASVNVNNTGTYNTSAGVTRAWGVRSAAIATRSVGANDLRCHAIEGIASAGQVNVGCYGECFGAADVNAAIVGIAYGATQNFCFIGEAGTFLQRETLRADGDIDHNGVNIGFNSAAPVAQSAAIVDAVGGIVVDIEARAALNTMLAYLRLRGDIAP